MCAIGVTFTPTMTGVRTGSLTFTDTAVGSPQTIKLSGTGKVTNAAARGAHRTSKNSECRAYRGSFGILRSVNPITIPKASSRLIVKVFAPSNSIL